MRDRFRGEAAPELGPEAGQEFIRAQESWGTLERDQQDPRQRLPCGELAGCSERGSWNGEGQVLVNCRVRAFCGKQRAFERKTDLCECLLCTRPCVNFFRYVPPQLFLIKILSSVLIL